jgi:nucleoside-diphosphate-sugar epimerase
MSNDGRKIVVTGGSGFIGTNLIRWFGGVEPANQIVILDLCTPSAHLPPNVTYQYGDIRNLNCLLDAFEDAEEVYNLAGILGTSELIPITSLATEVNVSGAANVFDAARRCKVKRLYNVAKPHFAGYHENAYTLTKHSAENLGLMYRDKYDMEIATVRWMNAVGPYQHLYPVRKLVPTLVLFALYGCDLEIYGSGNQTIDPIDTRDLCRYTTYACRHLGKSDEVVDLGSGLAITCNDAAKMILGRLTNGGIHSSSQVVHLPMREGEQVDCQIKANTEFWDSVGMSPKYTFEQSIDAVIEDVLNIPNYHRMNALAFYGKKIVHPLTGLNRLRLPPRGSLKSAQGA